MESVWLLYFVLMEISIVGFVFVKHSAIIKRSTVTPIKIFIFAHDNLVEARSFIQ